MLFNSEISSWHGEQGIAMQQCASYLYQSMSKCICGLEPAESYLIWARIRSANNGILCAFWIVESKSGIWEWIVPLQSLVNTAFWHSLVQVWYQVHCYFCVKAVWGQVIAICVKYQTAHEFFPGLCIGCLLTEFKWFLCNFGVGDWSIFCWKIITSVYGRYFWLHCVWQHNQGLAISMSSKSNYHLNQVHR